MFNLKNVGGYYVKEEKNRYLIIEYFIFGENKKLYYSKQFPLLNKIVKNSYNYKDLYQKLELNKINYILFEEIKTSKIKEYSNPEILPHINSNYIECIIKSNDKKIPLHLFSINNKNIQKLYKFLNEDNLKIDLTKLISKDDFISNVNKNYEKKMKLVINKINNDNLNNYKVEEKYVVGEKVENNSEKFVELNTGSHFSGEIKNNKPNGKGKEFLKDQCSFVGNFVDGNWNGLGYLADNENDICYGEFYKGNLIGI